jgi:hypothetical protein
VQHGAAARTIMTRPRAVAASCLLLLGQHPLAAQNLMVAEIPIEFARNKTGCGRIHPAPDRWDGA